MAVLGRTPLARIICLSCLIAFMPVGLPAHAEEQPLQLEEQKIEAGLIYNFIKYTDWSAAKMDGASSPIVICIFGQDPYNGYLQPIESRSVKQRNIVIHHIDQIGKTSDCHLLVIGKEENSLWPRLHEFLAEKDVLTVSDIDGFSAAGGMIQFSRNNDRIRMYLNTKAVAAAHLRIQDNLIRISTMMNSSARNNQ
jgi:hypothetical protein